jgi:hypothetical protein
VHQVAQALTPEDKNLAKGVARIQCARPFCA